VPRPQPAQRGPLTTVTETSAGGVVVEPGGGASRVALIAHRTRRGALEWVLPRGHVEPGETPEQAAVREVEEETGIRGRVRAELGTVDYWFVDADRKVHKTVHHFLLDGIGGALSPEDPQVERVEWVPIADAPRRLTHADERDLVLRARRLLVEPA